MDIYNFPGVLYATDGSKGSTGMVAGFTGTISKEVGAAGSGETSVAARPAGPNLRQRVWLLKIPSPMTNPLRFSTKRQTDGPTKVERILTMYDGMGLAYNLLSRGLRKESNTDAP